MAGIYIHIPYCRQACHYCDFHFSTNLKTKDEMIKALCQELTLRNAYINEAVETIYFGGGTPSLLSAADLDQILHTIYQHYAVLPTAEITLEANPEDLSEAKLEGLKSAGINRLSIGIQTFDDQKLKWMNRIHNTEQTLHAFKNARKAGFKNISLDLIYALPEAGKDHWEEDLSKILTLTPEHISLYGLTIEDKTVFGKREAKGELIELPEDEAASQYLHAIDYLTKNGYVQYEVSNFGKPGYHSRHNMAYWNGVPYLGIGPGAHSFDGASRQINVRNNAKYIKAIIQGHSHYETEELSNIQRLNEQLLTSLRTKDGIDFSFFKASFGVDLAAVYRSLIDELVHRELAAVTDQQLHLLPKGFLVADEIALRMFFPE